MREDLGLRHRAAFCHLATCGLITSVWLPWLLKKTAPDEDFLVKHANGAITYQLLGAVSFVVLWYTRHVPYLFLDEVRAGLLLALLGVVALCLLGLYFLGSLCAAFQAWNSEMFWLPLVNWLLGYESPSAE